MPNALLVACTAWAIPSWLQSVDACPGGALMTAVTADTVSAAMKLLFLIR
ncbi:hypothetical protein MM2B1231_2384 [Mycobacteroides abscessus subsp. bolletii 2B-1231]|uniref:Uncharacterized protein n=1 Tax=Mycobacteroides abscessus MAB_091912_2446 TaxID=1335414 RepID=A0A829MFN6_9MYCO|nr:hypothetical protein MM2B0626_2319 [Mycobacteroides abscessus subsp. bolletii 2B-0626]EIV11525.1 hypothetical protein MM2B0912R_2721 [Mycobacteroides abscessus subsp. bolletii 2B-0912-R]EIV75251.1 hypothetical protein MM2B1231_2384 [Mycobacteroides abscessus subsp. bolletii 2B-1231]ESV63651.1 hypothetical protein L833_1029 [Mycobacteroides abscessus MAB_091912_2446]ETZ77176.1 hypothetical protein L831_2336 [Mycobacteroides abscessus MAB_082312_2272]